MRLGECVAAYEDEHRLRAPDRWRSSVDHGFDTYFGAPNVSANFLADTRWFDGTFTIASPPTASPSPTLGLRRIPVGRRWLGWDHLSGSSPDPARVLGHRLIIAERGPDRGRFVPFLPLLGRLSAAALTPPIVQVNDAFRGVSGIGDYGDFVCEVDWVRSARSKSGATASTPAASTTRLVIFTSDNGPEDPDVAVDARASGLACPRALSSRTQHYSHGPLRGIKRFTSGKAATASPSSPPGPESFATAVDIGRSSCRVSDLFADLR